MKSPQYDDQNNACSHMPEAVDKPLWLGFHRVPPLREELPATNGCWESKNLFFSRINP